MTILYIRDKPVQSQPPLDGLNGLGRTKAILRLGAVQIIRDTVVCVWGGYEPMSQNDTAGRGAKNQSKKCQVLFAWPLRAIKTLHKWALIMGYFNCFEIVNAPRIFAS
jgi:hypothetical protein